MTSARQIQANRRNANLSTGPKTVTGRARSAQNATSHGLSALKPDPKTTLAFYRRIIEDRDAEIADGLEGGEKGAAMTLAACEEQVLKSRNAITMLDRKITPLMARLEREGLLVERQAALGELLASGGLPARLAKNPEHWIFEVIRLVGDISLLEPLRQALESRRKLHRYRLAAEAARKRALYAYLDSLDQKPFNWRGSDDLDTFKFTANELGL